jgi:hypothetical protein
VPDPIEPVDERPLRRTDTTHRAIAAAVAVAREHGLRVDELAVLADHGTGTSGTSSSGLR